jgi:thiol-disulfide isomerase/thioredoxin
MEVVYIGASWCGSCKTIKPQLIELCKKFSIDFKELDYDNDLNDIEQEAIRKVPTVRILKNGAQVVEFNSNQVAQTTSWFQTNVPLNSSDDF